MYSLHSERVAVGARQLWRQRVIVARQPDRPKMAELTGTGERARFTLALASLWQVGVVSPTDTPHDCPPRRKRCTLQQFVDGFLQEEPRRAEMGREADKSNVENLSLSASPLKLQLHKRQPPSSPGNHMLFHKEIIGSNGEQRGKLQEEENGWVKSEKEGVRRNYFLGEVAEERASVLSEGSVCETVKNLLPSPLPFYGPCC